MSEDRSGELTFAILDAEKGWSLPPATGEEFPLPAWYRTVWNTPLKELGVQDICRACQQDIHLEHIVPIALRMLASDPLAGEMYDGQILVSLQSVPRNYWLTHSKEQRTLRAILEEFLATKTEDDEVCEYAKLLLNRLPDSIKKP